MIDIKVGEEKERTVYDFPVDMGDKERIFFFEYAREKMTDDEFEDLMIEWALTKIVTDAVTEYSKNLNTENGE